MKKNIFPISIIAALSFTAFVSFVVKKNASSGIDLNNLDKTVKPSDDFFQFVNGNWIKSNAIPPSESSWGSFNELYEKNTKKLKEILISAAADKTAQPGSNIQKIGDYFALAMDSIKLNKDKTTPLISEFSLI